MRLRFLKQIIGVFLILLLAQKNYGQVSINQFLRSVDNDISLKVIDEQNSYLQGKPYSLSFVNRFQFRMQNNEGISKETQRFGLWLSPANPWAIKSTNKYFKTYAESLNFEREIAIKEALIERYNLVVDFLYFNELYQLYQKDKSLLDAQVNILEKQHTSDYFNATSFAELKLEQISKDVQAEEALFEMNNQIARIDAKYTAGYVKELNWHSHEIISVAQIETILDSINSNDNVPTLVSYQDFKIEMAKQSYNIQKSNINTGFIQGNYLNGNIAKDKTPWSFVAGITIPIANPNKGDMARKQLLVIEASQKKQVTEIRINEEKAIVLDKLNSLITRYKSTQAKIDAVNTASLGSTLSSMRENNPLVIVKLNSNVLKLELILLRLKQTIMFSYLEFLSIHDRLQQRPLVNYLSPSWSLLDTD